jgi:hypothetical protein
MQKICPKCSKGGRSRMTRWHLVVENGKLYLECERKTECGWRIQIALVSEQTTDGQLPLL